MFSLDDFHNNKGKYVVIGSTILVACIGTFIYFTTAKSNNNENIGLTSYDSLGQESTQSHRQSKKIVVDVKGAINKPGVYEFSEGTRVYEVVAKAGGTTAAADTTTLNLAQTVLDGSVIHIPKRGEITPSSAGNPQRDKININTATLEEIEKLEGIGPAKAKAILSYRKECGRFKDVSELKKVSGIGDKLFKRISDQIIVQ